MIPWLFKLIFPGEYKRRRAHKAKMEQLLFWRAECLRIGSQMSRARSLEEMVYLRQRYDVAAKRFDLEVSR